MGGYSFQKVTLFDKSSGKTPGDTNEKKKEKKMNIIGYDAQFKNVRKATG